jgi:hypothetical protein
MGMSGRPITRGVVWSLIVVLVVGLLAAGPGTSLRTATAQEEPTVTPGGSAPVPIPALASPGPVAAPASESPTADAGPSGQVVSATLFPDLLLGNVQNGLLPNSVTDDHQILLGGVGSDLWHGPGDPDDEFWMVTDRGPRGRDDNGKDRQAFAVPEYTPMLFQVRLTSGGIEVVQTIPIVGQSGKPVSGLPNLDGRDERPVDFRAKAKLTYNPSGLDPEGLARTPDGHFWIADEYGPSLVHLDANGVVLKRFVPEGVVLAGADYPVVEGLPAVFGKRADEGGFEGLTASLDGSTLYLAMQGPLSNPNNDTGDKSRNARILAFDVASEQVTAEYVYRFDMVRAFDPSKKADPDDMKVSALAMCPNGQLLVLERTNKAARLYRADLQVATNILGTRWDDVTVKPSLEAADSLAVVGIIPLTKSLAVDLTPMGGVPEKLEGVAILDASTLVVANDNDFDIGKFDSKGNNVGQGERTQIVTIGLNQPLP